MPRGKGGGRPTKMTPETIAKLEEAWTWGCSDREACLNADIDLATLYRYCQKNPKFSDRKEVLKDNPLRLSKQVVVEALLAGDIQTAHKILDRHEGRKLKLMGEDGGPVRIAKVEYEVVDS